MTAAILRDSTSWLTGPEIRGMLMRSDPFCATARLEDDDPFTLCS